MDMMGGEIVRAGSKPAQGWDWPNTKNKIDRMNRDGQDGWGNRTGGSAPTSRGFQTHPQYFTQKSSFYSDNLLQINQTNILSIFRNSNHLISKTRS